MNRARLQEFTRIANCWAGARYVLAYGAFVSTCFLYSLFQRGIL